MVSRTRNVRGAVTAELAMVLPLLVALTVGLVWLLTLATHQVRAVDAARETARALARGEEEPLATERGRRIAPPGSQITVIRDEVEIRVVVTGGVEGPGGLFARLPSPRLRAEAVAANEEYGP